MWGQECEDGKGKYLLKSPIPSPSQTCTHFLLKKRWSTQVNSYWWCGLWGELTCTGSGLLKHLATAMFIQFFVFIPTLIGEKLRGLFAVWFFSQRAATIWILKKTLISLHIVSWEQSVSFGCYIVVKVPSLYSFLLQKHCWESEVHEIGTAIWHPFGDSSRNKC